jgi:hypothetical protein
VLKVGSTVIDMAAYPGQAQGISAGLGPAQLTAAANDLAANFCPATTTGAFAGTGTPRALNDLCPWECLDGGVPRLAVWPQAGELVITEIFPDPQPDPEDNHDWLEVFVAAAVDLNGLVVRNVNATPTTRTWTLLSTDRTCLEVASGTYHVIGGSNVGLDGVTATATLVGVAATLLWDTPASLSIEAGATVVDTVNYGDPTVRHSWSLDPAILAADLNDVAANWCVAAGTDQFDSGVSWGSPTLANRTDCP